MPVLLRLSGAVVWLSLALLASAVETMRVVGSASATAPLETARESLRQAGLELELNQRANSTSAIALVADEQAEAGLTVRPLAAVERAESPRAQLTQTRLAQQVVVPLVGREIWEAGVRSLSLAQAKGIYEGRLKNWRDVGGPDVPIYFYNPAQGSGVWEIFAGWVYGDLRRAPLGDQFDPVDGREQTLKAVTGDPGALAYGFLSWADGRQLFALAVKLEDGTTVAGSLTAAARQGYPLTRPLYLITPGRPFGASLQVLSFLRSEAGRAALAKSEFLAVEPADGPSE